MLAHETSDARAPGSRIADRYRIARLLGKGGMGYVYEAEHLITGQRVALKVLKRQLAAEDRIVARFMREARAAATIAHPNAIQVADVFRDETGTPVMVMELLEGEGLDRVMARGRVPFVELARILVPVLEAIGAAHAKGVIHRDLKPENIFLARGRADEIVPKVLDFGIAKVLSANGIEEMRLTSTGTMVGTPYYMAPEQLSGRSDVDHRADLWGLGVLLYEALSGKLPFPGENFGQVFSAALQREPEPLGSLAPDVPAEVVELVHRCLAKDVARRPASAEEMAALLAPYAGLPAPRIGAPVSIPPSLISGSYEALADSDVRPLRRTGDVAADTMPSGPIQILRDLRASQAERARAESAETLDAVRAAAEDRSSAAAAHASPRAGGRTARVIVAALLGLLAVGAIAYAVAIAGGGPRPAGGGEPASPAAELRPVPVVPAPPTSPPVSPEAPSGSTAPAGTVAGGAGAAEAAGTAEVADGDGDRTRRSRRPRATDPAPSGAAPAPSHGLFEEL